MNFDALSYVKFGDKDSLGVFLFENGLQHTLFRQVFQDQGIYAPAYPLIDANIDNLDDWLLSHQVEHNYFAALLDLQNPFNMLDANWNIENDFYDWLSTHLYIHQQIASTLNLS
jgi:hypothetical protein